MPNRKPLRRSSDRMERIEWQLDQIRANTQVIAFIIVLIFLIIIILIFVNISN